ncbi:MAG: pitrilysin family protein [Planctomycetota bacterium]|nr:pitrilysin family protein [Planctomycetota bacterium]
MSYRRMICLLAVSLLPLAAKAQAPKKVAEVEGITEYRLDNGCRVLLLPDQSSSSVTVNVTLFVGSRHEGYGETGMAHLLEHMLFKGTPSHANIPKELKDRGVINMNGTTSYDRTNYYETLPASDENLEWAISMEADRMMNSYVKGEDLQSEMTVVRNEFERGENSPFRMLFQRILANAYEWHNYGKSTIGNRVDIERVPIASLKNFYRKYYRPDNAMVVVAGKFDPQKGLEYCTKYFGALANPKAKLPKTYTEEPPQDGERFVSLNRVGDVPMLGVAYHVTSAAHPDYAAVQVLTHVLGTEPSGKLYKKLVETGLASSVFADSLVGHDPGVLLCMLEVKKGQDPGKVRSVLLETIQDVAREGVTEAEVKRATTEYLKNRENLLANSEQFAIQLTEWASYGDWRLFFLHRDRLEKVTAADVQRVAADYLKTSNRTVGEFVPTEKPDRSRIPASPSVADLVKNYKGRARISQGEAFDPTPENISSRLVQGKLSTGIKYALLPRKTRLDRVFMRLTLRYGNEKTLTPANVSDAADLLPTLWMRGTQSLSYQEFQDRVNDLKASISASGSAGSVTFDVTARKETFAEVLTLLKDVLREPLFPEKDFEEIKTSNLTTFEGAKSDPMYLGQIAFVRKTRNYPSDNIRYVPTILESIERMNRVTVGDVRNLYKNFLGGTVGELTIVGAFDAEQSLGLIQNALEGWKSDIPYERIRNEYQKPKKESISINTPDKKMAVFFAGTNIEIRDDDPDWEAMFIGNTILGGGALANRLGERVRQKEGLSYGIRSMFQANSQDRSGSFMTQAITNPGNRDRLVEVINEEYDKIIKEGVSPDELERAKEGYIKQLNGILGKETQLLGILHRFRRMDRDPGFLARRLENVSRLSKKDVDSAIKKMVDLDNLVIVTAGDFEGAKKKEKEKK